MTLSNLTVNSYFPADYRTLRQLKAAERVRSLHVTPFFRLLGKAHAQSLKDRLSNISLRKLTGFRA
jgi:hypothetical protein